MPVSRKFSEQTSHIVKLNIDILEMSTQTQTVSASKQVNATRQSLKFTASEGHVCSQTQGRRHAEQCVWGWRG